MPPEEEDAVIKPKAARATMKNPLPNEEKVHAAPRGADPVEPAPVDP